jgi:hypothetical protein
MNVLVLCKEAGMAPLDTAEIERREVYS